VKAEKEEKEEGEKEVQLPPVGKTEKVEMEGTGEAK